MLEKGRVQLDLLVLLDQTNLVKLALVVQVPVMLGKGLAESDSLGLGI